MPSDSSELILPVVHSNGTSLDRLQAGYDRVADALRELHAALDSVEFNGRDYYVHSDGPSAFQKATRQRNDAIAGLKPLGDYIDAHREHLCAQELARK